MTIHDLDGSSVNFIIELRSISKDLSLWASQQLLRGVTLEDVRASIMGAVLQLEAERNEN